MIPVRTKFSLAPWLVAVVVLSMLLDPQQAVPAPQPTAVHHRPPAASSTARADIPPRYLRLYRKAGDDAGIPWSVLAAIGKVESDHGRTTLPGVHSGSNAAGACGPMQIGCVPGSRAGNSWAKYGRGDVHRPEDAIPGAARYLVGHGARRDLPGAIYGYNPAGWYVDKVLAWNHRYAH
jgi:peptidoglycan DL-endopeptidase CwlO